MARGTIHRRSAALQYCCMGNMSSEAAPVDPAPAAAPAAGAETPAPADGAPVEKTEKQLKREAEKKAKKAAEAAKKAAKLEARQVRGQSSNTVTVGVVPNPPVELEPASGTRDSTPTR